MSPSGASHRQPRPADEFLARLGLPPSASSEDVEDTHRAVVEFLATAPSAIRGWAHGQATAADQALLLLTDPGAATGPALRDTSPRPAVLPGGPATPPARRASRSRTKPVPVADPEPIEELEADDVDQELTAEEEALDLLASVTPSMHRDSVPGRRTAPRADRRPAPVRASPAPVRASRAPVRSRGWAGGWLRRAGIVAVIVLGAGGIAFAGYSVGGGGTPTASPGPTGAATATGPVLDEARVASLMAQVQANPRDVNALLALADEFYAVGQWQTAATWLDKVIEVEPGNVRALLARGATSFNLGDMAAAESTWLAVVEIDPANVEAHYDLGFLYLNREPPDLAGVQREWSKVIELAPDTDLARTVKTHLDALVPASAAPSGAPTPAATGAGMSPAPASPAPSAEPGASAPAPSPAPSDGATP